ncbi:B12-binding domain-containing radical SAM protein [Geovibrio ferrireducens]|uniref:B12-binding domain-containing radical SAM protein n=1 Tax=Geovibrio ferrireducens TaxID=46201 RepID=UPI00224550A0|nr:radical SAM protein [Geovibrio ferrireducens]
MKKVLLINSSFSVSERRYSSFGPPLGIISVASALRESGYRVIFVDPQVEENYEEMIRIALDDELLFVGMSAYMGANLKNCLKLTREVKAMRPDLPVVWGGPLASSLPEECFRKADVDFIVMGAGEETIVQLAAYLADKEPGKVLFNPYISFRKDENKYEIGRLYSFNGDIENLPAIDLRLWEKGIKKMNSIPLITSRGCPYKCSFCYNTFNEKGKYFLRTAQSIIDEMDSNSVSFSCTNFSFIDDNFLINENRALDVFAHAEKKGYRIQRVYGHLNNFTPKIQEALIKGKIGVTMCIESGSARIRKILNKHIDTDKAVALIRNLTSASVPFVTAFLFGIPGEEFDDIRQSVGLAKIIDGVSDGKAVSMFYLYAPQPKDRIVEEYERQGVKLDFAFENMSDVEVVPVPPNDMINLQIRPWMTGDMAEFYKNLAEVWLYHFGSKKNKGNYSLENAYKNHSKIKELFL